MAARSAAVTAARDHCSAVANQQPASRLVYSQRNMDEAMIQVNGWVNSLFNEGYLRHCVFCKTVCVLPRVCVSSFHPRCPASSLRSAYKPVMYQLSAT